MMGSVRDDLLMSLLASEAIVDSRGYEILSAEEVEEFKKVRCCLDVWDACINVYELFVNVSFAFHRNIKFSSRGWARCRKSSR